MREIIFPAQCSCGHLYLERYQFKEPVNGIISFCWCVFCHKRYNIMAKETLPAPPQDAGKQA